MLDWSKYIAVADRFQYKAKADDVEDLNHTVILSLAQAQTAKDNNGGGQLSDVAMLRVASYECQKYWRSIKRQLIIMSTDALREAIARGDPAMLTQIPGIGKKTAERVMLDLKDKLGVGLEFVSYPALTHADAELISALTSLGYSIAEAQSALRSLPPEDLPLEDRIRLALQYFATQ